MWAIPNSSADINTDSMKAVLLKWYSAVGNDSDNIASNASTKMSTLFPQFNLYGLMMA